MPNPMANSMTSPSAKSMEIPMANTMANMMSAFPPETPIGMCYVPMQKITTVYEPENAWKRGTIFPDLDKPFLDGRGYEK